MTIEPVKINDHIFVEVQSDGKKYHIYTVANGKHVGTCRFALCNVPTNEEDEVQSIDELLSKYSIPENEKEYIQAQSSLDASEELFVHASNIAGWAESGYDWRLMDSRIGLPILSEIWKVDIKAEHALFDLVASRWDSGNDSSRLALVLMTDPEVLCILAKNKLIDLQSLRATFNNTPKNSNRGEFNRIMYVTGLITEDAYFAGIETDPDEIASWKNAISYYKNREGGRKILRDAIKNKTMYLVADFVHNTSLRHERKAYVDPFSRAKARITREFDQQHKRWGFNDTSMVLSSVYYYEHNKFTDFFHPCCSEPIDYAVYIYSKGAMLPVEYSQVPFVTSTYNAPISPEWVKRTKYKLVHHVSIPKRYRDGDGEISVYQVDVPDDATHVFPYHVLYGDFKMSCIVRRGDGTFEKMGVKFTCTTKHVKHYTPKKKTGN
jgi:hypothetical protein